MNDNPAPGDIDFDVILLLFEQGTGRFHGAEDHRAQFNGLTPQLDEAAADA